MNKNYFFQISTDPDVDARKCAVAMACAAQAVADGHTVSVFFASHAVKLLHRDFIENMDKNTCNLIMNTYHGYDKDLMGVYMNIKE